MRRLVAAGLVVCAGTGAGWLDRWQHARAGNQFYEQGKYEDAVNAYNQGLTEDPDSTVLHFNLGAAQFKQSQYEAALKALQQVPLADDTPDRTARAAYNLGTTAYKLGTMSEGSQPQKALEAWAQALAFYRRALGVRPDDADTKFNYEFVVKRIADLKQKLEEQKQQQQDQQQKDQDQQDQQPKDEQAEDQEKKDQQPQDQAGQPEEQPQEQAQEQPPDQANPEGQGQPPPPEQAQGGTPDDQPPTEGEGGDADSDVAGEKKDGEMSKKEAVAVLDGERNQEVQPEEVVKRLQGARVGRPAKDW